MAAASYVAYRSSSGAHVTVNYDDVTLVVSSFDLAAGVVDLSVTVTYTKTGRTQSTTVAANTTKTITPNRTISLSPDPDIPSALVQSDFAVSFSG